MLDSTISFLYDGLKGGIGIKMSWVEKNRKINNPGEGKIIRDSRVRHFSASKTPYRDRIDLIQTLKGRCMVNTIGSKVRFYVCFLTNKKFLPLLEGNILLLLFLIILI